MKFKFKNLIAFTLSEMMIVLLIVSVISAATIPTITQQKQKPYNVTENNSTSANDVWKYDNFSGIFNDSSISDSDQKIVIGTDTKNYTSAQINDYKTAFDGTKPAVVIQRNQGGLTTTADRGQIVLYDQNKYMGSVALDGSNNIMIGANAATNQTYGIGTYNTVIGYYSGFGISDARTGRNILIGEYASSKTPEADYTIAIGKYAAYNSSFEYKNVSIGECAGSNVCYGPVKYANKGNWTMKAIVNQENVAIGAMAGRLGYKPLADLSISPYSQNLRHNVSIGYYSGNYGYGITGNTGRDMQLENISIGSFAGLNNSYSNTINVGYYAGSRNSTTKPDYHEMKESNINIGAYAGGNDEGATFPYNPSLVSSYGQNVKIGYYAGYRNFGIMRSVIIGSYANAKSHSSTFVNGLNPIASTIAIGYYAMYESNSSDSIAIGPFSDVANGSRSIAIGTYAGLHSAATNSIMIGRNAGHNATLIDSIVIGNFSGYFTSKRNSVILGGYAQSSSTMGGNVQGSNKYIIVPYVSSTLVSDTGNKFSMIGERPQMIIGPGYGQGNGAATQFANTKLLLYASKVYARQTTMTLFSSDRRAKENIKKAKYGISQVRHLNAYTFNFKSDATKKVNVGLIAQEVQKYIPEAVVKTAGGKLSIEFDWILFPVANAIKDIDKTLTQMNKDLLAQAKQLVSLERHVEKLEQKVTATMQKQEKMQYKLNDTKEILNKMENK